MIKNNFIFVHIPRTAGISEEKALGSNIIDHRYIYMYINDLGYENFKLWKNLE